MIIYNSYKSASFYQNFVADIFIYRFLHRNVTMKTSFAIMGIIAAVALVTAIAAPNAFALSQSSTQINQQGTGQTQASGLNLFSPQTSAQISGQSSIQAACVFFSFGCG